MSIDNNSGFNMSQILAWPTDQHEIVRARIAEHRRCDEIVQGTGWEKGKGCAIGCSLDSYDRIEYARVLGIPLPVAHLIDAIHEMLPRELALDWPGRVANALQPGIETTHAWSRFAICILREGRISGKEGGIIDKTVILYERRMAGDEPPIEEWEAIAYIASQAWKSARMTNKARDITRAAERIANSGSLAGRVIRKTSWNFAQDTQEAAFEAANAARAAGIRIPPQFQADALIEILSADT